MGRRGPPPKPTQIKLVTGNPGCRPINVLEPKPKKVAPTAPTWLTKPARDHWRKTVKLLQGMGVLTVVDGDALAAYCALWVRWVEIEKTIESKGTMYVTQYGQQCPIPEMAQAKAWVQMIRQYQQEFGLTPSARSRITLAPPKDEKSAVDEMRAASEKAADGA